MTTTGNADADVNTCCQLVSNEIFKQESFVVFFFRTEFVQAKDQERFVDFESEDFRLDEGERFAVDFDKTFARLFLSSAPIDFQMGIDRFTLQCATAVAVFFLPNCAKGQQVLNCYNRLNLHIERSELKPWWAIASGA